MTSRPKLASATALLLLTPSAFALTYTVGYPPPGNVTFSGVGVAGDDGGKTNTYTSLNHTGYFSLYWGATSVGSATDGNINLASPEIMTFSAGSSNFALGKAVYTGSTTMSTTVGILGVNTRFTLTVTDLANNPIPLRLPTSIPGFPTSSAAVAKITGNSFKVNLYFEGSTGGAYQSLNPLFNSYNTISQDVRTSVDGFFFWSNPIIGDINRDGAIDLTDLNNVLNNFGSHTPGNPGDSNGDNSVDLGDLNNVLNNFGVQEPEGLSLDDAAVSSIPEPASALLLLAIPAIAGLARHRRNRP